jgi:hypothetical protein
MEIAFLCIFIKIRIVKNILFLIIIVFLIACGENEVNYPTAGKIDTLSSDIELRVKASMKTGQEAIPTFRQDSIYDLQ